MSGRYKPDDFKEEYLWKLLDPKEDEKERREIFSERVQQWIDVGSEYRQNMIYALTVLIEDKDPVLGSGAVNMLAEEGQYPAILRAHSYSHEDKILPEVKTSIRKAVYGTMKIEEVYPDEVSCITLSRKVAIRWVNRAFRVAMKGMREGWFSHRTRDHILSEMRNITCPLKTAEALNCIGVLLSHPDFSHISRATNVAAHLSFNLARTTLKYNVDIYSPDISARGEEPGVQHKVLITVYERGGIRHIELDKLVEEMEVLPDDKDYVFLGAQHDEGPWWEYPAYLYWSKR